MGRKRRFSRLLLYAAMLSTIGAGVLGSVPLPVKAAEEEETYTVRFEAYEGTCETGSVSVPKGESIILPDASYEGHYLMNWIEAVKGENMTTFLSVGTAGSEYTPERDMWLYANWKPNQKQEPEPGQDITVTYEARIGDTGYEELEEAFINAQAGDTITVLKDCRVSVTLEVTADNITLKSEDAGNPVTVSREEGFSGKYYGTNTDTVLLAVTGGSLVIRDCNITGNLSAGFSHAGGAICYMNETGIILSGKIVMEDNLAAGYEPCDIHYFYNTGASILLDEDFESASTFVLGGYDSIKPGRVLIDGTLYHKDARRDGSHYMISMRMESWRGSFS